MVMQLLRLLLHVHIFLMPNSPFQHVQYWFTIIVTAVGLPTQSCHSVHHPHHDSDGLPVPEAARTQLAFCCVGKQEAQTGIALHNTACITD
jgi:hypothetical protein